MSEAAAPRSPADALTAAFLRHAAARPAGAVAVTPLPPSGGAGGIGWDALATGAARLARWLHGQGLRAGDRIGWIGPNDAMQIVLLAACARLGLAQVPLNWRLSVEELRWIEEDAGLRLLCAPVGGRRHPDPVFTHPYLDDVASRRAGMLHDPLDHAGDPGGTAAALPDGAAAPEAPLLVGYTSGTTGRPKGAVLPQRAFVANAANAQALFGLSPADRVLAVLPMFHIGGLAIQTLPALLAGAEVLLATRFDPDLFFDACEARRPTLSLLVPAVMQALVSHPRWAAADLSSLRAVGAGSSEVPLRLIEAFHARGIPVQQVYGATETGPIAIAQTREEALAAPGSIGRPAPLCAARIQDPEGRPLPPGTEGEIAVRGPNLMQGYLNRSGATAAALSAEGWFATGDVGRMDAEGRYWFTDRVKLVIISGGENIYPAEVERVLRDVPGVLECAVCGRPDPRWGEVPVAVVVPGPGFGRAAVMRHFEGRLARFKHPHDLVVVEALPRTALGKVRFDALRELACRPPG